MMWLPSNPASYTRQLSISIKWSLFFLIAELKIISQSFLRSARKKNYQLKGTSTSCIVHPPTTNVSRGFLTQKWYAVENRSRSNYLQFVIATNAIEEKKHYRCAAAASLSHPRSMWTRALVWGFYCCCCNLRRCRRSSQTAVGCFASLANRVAESKTRFLQLCNEKKKTETSREVLRAPRDCWILIKATIK